jgi:hypothetical protein
MDPVAASAQTRPDRGDGVVVTIQWSSNKEAIMAQIICEVSEGLRKSEATVKLVTFEGRPEFLPVDRGLLSAEGDKHFLSVPVIHVNREKNAVLIGLPVEADSGAHRIWVHLDRIKQELGTSG